jgi:hypothetical protein
MAMAAYATTDHGYTLPVTDPTERSGAAPTSEATLRAVQADRARVEAARTAARRSRRSPRAIADKLVRWLRDRRTGPLGRLRRAAQVVRATAVAGGPWRGLPAAVARTLGRPPGSTPLPRPRALRDPAADRPAAATRLRAAAAGLATRPAAGASIAAVAGPSGVAALAGAGRVTALRPEDWRAAVEAAPPDLLVLVGADAEGGPWAYRIAWAIHPDRLLPRDLDALTRWAADAGVPSVFVLTADAAPDLDDWRGAADACDLVVAPDAATAARLAAGPGRRGAGVVVGRAGDLSAALRTAEGAIGALLEAGA